MKRLVVTADDFGLSREVNEAVEIEVGQRSPPGHGDAGHAGLVADLNELAVSTLQEQVVGILYGEIRHGVDVALRDEEVDQPVIVHILELGMPTGTGTKIVTHIGPVRRHAPGEGDVCIAGLCRPGGRSSGQ